VKKIKSNNQLIADYEYFMQDGVLVLHDLACGSKPLSDDMIRAIKHIKQNSNFPLPKYIIYRDSSGIYNRVKHSGKRFLDFTTLQINLLEDAVERVKED